MTSSHITSQHMTSPPRNGWRLVDTKNSEEPSVTLPRPNWSDQYDTTTPKLKSSLVPYRTCYQTKTLGMNDQPVWVRHSLFKHESKSWAVRPRTQICWTFTSPLQKSCVACWARPRSCYFPRKCTMLTTSKYSNKKPKKQKKGRNCAIPVLIGGLASNLLPDGMPKAC